jgi:hypothetical protein
MTGPTSQVSPPPEGEKKNDASMSLTPKAGAPPSKSTGWLTKGYCPRAYGSYMNRAMAALRFRGRLAPARPSS